MRLSRAIFRAVGDTRGCSIVTLCSAFINSLRRSRCSAMPPKKTTSEEVEPRAQPSDDEATEGEAARSRKSPPTAVMVLEAVKALDSRKGVTSQAIRNYIKKIYPMVDISRLTYLVRQALTKTLSSGELVLLENPNPSGMKKYKLASKVKAAKQKGENADPNVQKKAKPPKEVTKKSSKEEGGKTKKSPASEEQAEEEPKPTKKPKKDKPAKTLEATEPKKPSRKKEAEKSPSAKPRSVKAPKVPKAAGATKGRATKAASNAPPAAKPGRAKKSAQ